MILALLLSGPLLSAAATMPCCASTAMPDMQMASPAIATCHDVSSPVERHAADALTAHTADLVGCEHVACAPATNREWTAEQVEAHVTAMLMPLVQAGHVAPPSSSGIDRSTQAVITAPAGQGTTLPMRV